MSEGPKDDGSSPVCPPSTWNFRDVGVHFHATHDLAPCKQTVLPQLYTLCLSDEKVKMPCISISNSAVRG
jgi:hypothetical protein